jgi:hypothetical protein
MTAVPTPIDVINAIKAIKETKEDLKDALCALAEAQRRVTDLEKNLGQLRAWVAPIRRLPFDSLSLVFEFCGEDDWKTPLRISEVSRQWRSVVLETPRAWASLDLKDIDNESRIFSIRNIDEFAEDSVFPFLDRLAIRNDDLEPGIFYINDTRFPSLKHLKCGLYVPASRVGLPRGLPWSRSQTYQSFFLNSHRMALFARSYKKSSSPSVIDCNTRS